MDKMTPRVVRYCPGLISGLNKNQIFVFGSNLAGRHGKGAALTAKKWGAKNGQGEGLMGKTYGIPTKNEKIKTMPLGFIEYYVANFLIFANQHPELEFLVTKIGCGLAGYTEYDIAPLFMERNPPANVLLPVEFWDAYLKN